MQSRIVVLDEIRQPPQTPDGWCLCFQRALYTYPNGKRPEPGFRFIWRRDDDSLQPARGQARIPKLEDVRWFLEQAEQRSWGVEEAT